MRVILAFTPSASTGIAGGFMMAALPQFAPETAGSTKSAVLADSEIR